MPRSERREAEPVPSIVVPTKGTLRRYGMTAEEWLGIVESQGGKCPICKRIPKSGRLVIDHQHVPGWKKKRPEERRRYVRGIVCFLCNGKCLSKWTTKDRAMAVVQYLIKYERRGT